MKDKIIDMLKSSDINIILLGEILLKNNISLFNNKELYDISQYFRNIYYKQEWENDKHLIYLRFMHGLRQKEN